MPGWLKDTHSVMSKGVSQTMCPSSVSTWVWTMHWKHPGLLLILDGVCGFELSKAWFWHQFMLKH